MPAQAADRKGIMIGIIGAMAEEVAELKNIMTDTLEHKIGDMTFVSGKLCGADAVITVCGEGKVNAAMCTQAMIMEYAPELIINTGVGGGLTAGLKIGDIVVASAVVEHDLDASALGHERGYVFGLDCVEMPCDPKISALLMECTENFGISCRRGIIASGDQFINSTEKKKWLVDTFNASVCEMEGAAIGHVCMRNKVPFGVLRSISDGGDEGAAVSFTEFATQAIENSVRIIKLFAERAQTK